MKYKYLLILVLFISCNYKTQRKVYSCNSSQLIEVKKFIQSSIKNANNMSDEEMEDVIIQLEHTAIKTICNQKIVNCIQHDGWIEIIEKNDTLNFYDY